MADPRLPDPDSGADVADHALLGKMANGDEQALGELYDRWCLRVHSLAVQFLGDEDEAEDVVEEAFWQAWRSADRYDRSRGSVGTWLLMITRSRALDRVRARGRSREESGNERAAPAFDSPLVSVADDPLDRTRASELRDAVMRALGELPTEQRQALEMAYYGGLSQSEIAERTGQPLGTVKTRVRLATQKLKERLSFLRGEVA